MTCPHHPGLGSPSCRECQQAHGWPVQLMPDERAELRNRLIRGEQVDLSGFSYADRLALGPFVQPHAEESVIGWPRHSEPSRGQTGERPVLAEIIERLNAATTGSPLEDPSGFLRRGDHNALANLLNSEDFNTVMKMREADAAPLARLSEQQVSAPVPPSREEITAEVLRRHAAGHDPGQIARDMKLGRSLALYIIDQNTK